GPSPRGETAIRPPDGLVLELQPDRGDQPPRRPNLDLVIVTCRTLVRTVGLDDGQLDALRFHLPVRPAELPEQIRAADLEPHQIVGVVDDAHLVRLRVPDADQAASGRHQERCGVGSASAARALSARVADSASGVPNTPFPATRMVAPAFTARRMVCGAMPPSTSMSARLPARASSSRALAILDSVPGIKACPPNPGSTDMISSWSKSPVISSIADRGVAGLSATPARHPSSRIRVSVRCRWGRTSACTEIVVAPASAKASRY